MDSPSYIAVLVGAVLLALAGCGDSPGIEPSLDLSTVDTEMALAQVVWHPELVDGMRDGPPDWYRLPGFHLGPYDSIRLSWKIVDADGGLVGAGSHRVDARNAFMVPIDADAILLEAGRSYRFESTLEFPDTVDVAEMSFSAAAADVIRLSTKLYSPAYPDDDFDGTSSVSSSCAEEPCAPSTVHAWTRNPTLPVAGIWGECYERDWLSFPCEEGRAVADYLAVLDEFGDDVELTNRRREPAYPDGVCGAEDLRPGRVDVGGFQAKLARPGLSVGVLFRLANPPASNLPTTTAGRFALNPSCSIF